MLFDLAGAAGLEQKRAAMAAGHHINTTEDRAVMHIALRAPVTKQLIVDGADVVPDVHAVLNKVWVGDIWFIVVLHTLSKLFLILWNQQLLIATVNLIFLLNV